MKFTEEKLEKAFYQTVSQEGGQLIFGLHG